MAERVVVLGTGMMGAPTARNLLKAGFQVRVWNRTPNKARVLAAEGADLAENPADAVREAAFVITMLTDAAAVLTVMGQAAESVPDGAVWLQTSMVGRDVERVAGLAKDHGITFVDGPVIGTRETAKQGRLVVLASGLGDALDRAQPIFDAIGSKTVRLEPEAGGASRIKLVANAWTVGLVESLRAQLSRAARWACSRRIACPSRDRLRRPLARNGLRPELVPPVEVLEVLPTVDHPAVLELEDDAVGNIQVLAVSVRGAALDADHAVVTICGQVAQLGPEGPSGLLRKLAEVRQGRVAALVVVGHRAPARQVPHGALVEDLGERVDVARVEGVVGALHDRYVLIWSHRFSLSNCPRGVPSSQA